MVLVRMVPKVAPGYVELLGSDVAAICFWGGRDCNRLQGEGTVSVVSPMRLGLCVCEQDGQDQREKCLCQNWQTWRAAAQWWVSPAWHGTVQLALLRHSSPGRHEASSPGRSQLAAGHRRWEGNRRDERKRSSQGGAKLWPEKAAPMVGLYQTHRAPSRDVLRAPSAPGQGHTCRSILCSLPPLESVDATFSSLFPLLLVVLSPLL